MIDVFNLTYPIIIIIVVIVIVLIVDKVTKDGR